MTKPGAGWPDTALTRPTDRQGQHADRQTDSAPKPETHKTPVPDTTHVLSGRAMGPAELLRDGRVGLEERHGALLAALGRLPHDGR